MAIKDLERKPYARPEILQVRLAPSDAVLNFCKDGLEGMACGPGELCTVEEAGS